MKEGVNSVSDDEKLGLRQLFLIIVTHTNAGIVNMRLRITSQFLREDAAVIQLLSLQPN